MTIDKQKLHKLLWAEVAAWSASSPDWLDNSQALEDFLGKQTLEEVALEVLAENERFEREAKNDLIAYKAVIERQNELRAEIAGLKTGYEAYERVNAELKAECEALRRGREGKVLCDMELFETLRDSANTEADEHRQCMATYRPLRQANLDSVVKKCDDLLAAMGQGEQS
ncbi:hypothetical protein [Pseudomonas sp. St316]|uniref:hypothetical protein n=1 Tax=Pseudomonas sp. St316 TaxID=2678257 RepID=UPI001BB3A0A4|nr:hypothetical protein [Pseudomonas sp. St316]BBP60381.1 hypothetical protein PHLH4_39710 [Pseudomonas sp. St316]